VGVVVPLSAAEAKEASLNPLLELVAPDMEKVNAQILQHAESHVELIPQLAQHLIDSGGKRLRPMLTIASARMCGYAQGNYHVDLATAVEFMHTATLLHDDVVDESDLRRGRRTARLIWGNQASVLVGDYLLGQAFRIMVGTGRLTPLPCCQMPRRSLPKARSCSLLRLTTPPPPKMPT
jgi:octaprenyl-diphosphate synthase